MQSRLPIGLVEVTSAVTDGNVEHVLIIDIIPSFKDSPKSFWWYHLMCWLLSAVGILCILVAHEHYTVDVVVAYFITSRLFWWYHTMANLQVTRKFLSKNILSLFEME